jgi:hypothetical protein
MKQLEIDSEIHSWFAALDRKRTAERELNSAQCDLANKTSSVAKRLMPSDAKAGEVYIFPSTDGKAVRCFLKPTVAHGTNGTEHRGLELCVEGHDFNRK